MNKLTALSQGGKEGRKSGSKIITEWDKFGRTGLVQVLHIDLFYADGTKGVINVTSPGIIWGEDIETQWIGMKTYLQSESERLGIIRYHARAYVIHRDGAIIESISWSAYDCVKGCEANDQTLPVQL